MLLCENFSVHMKKWCFLVLHW